MVAPIKPCLFGKTSNYAWVYSPEKIKDLQNSMCPNKALEALCALNDSQGCHKGAMISSVKSILRYNTKIKENLAERLIKFAQQKDDQELLALIKKNKSK